jgi:CheY-like chemotaxis protein
VIVDIACEPINSAGLEEQARLWKLPNTPFMACPLPGEEPLRQRLAVDSYLLKPISRQSLWDVLRQFGQEIDSVLVVDDDRDFVRLLSRMLDSPVRRYQVISAYSGQEGLALFSRHRPDLVLLDLGLPDMDGIQVIERIRSKPDWRHVPVVVVSAQDEIDHLETLAGTMLIAKADGLLPYDLVQWAQKVLDTATRARLSSPEDEAYPVGRGETVRKAAQG